MNSGISQNMKILKFGGTSLSNSEKFLHVTTIIEHNLKKEQIAVVLSAPEKITNLLTSTIENVINKKSNKLIINKIKNTFLKLINNIYKIEKNLSYTKTLNIIEEKFIKLDSMFHGIQLLQKCPNSIRAKIICLGETLSIEIMNAILLARHNNVTIIDPVKKLLSIGKDYLNSTIDIKKSKSRISSMKIPKNHTILMAGFTAGNNKGELVTLGRNGSDYSAAILSVCLESTTCEIWTDVDGIYTCDPKLVSDAKLLTSLSYQEAMELSYFGAKVLHPRTIYPLQKFKIPCIIKNTHNPSAMGTKIYNNNEKHCNSVKGITYINNITMFSISCPNINNMTKIASRIFSCMSLAKIWVILITQSSSQNIISFCILTTKTNEALDVLNHEFQLELQNKLLTPIQIVNKLAIISIVTSDIQSRIDIPEKIFSALKHVNINTIAISKGSSKHSLSIVINDRDTTLGIKSIHKKIFNKKRIIEALLIGVGGIGKTFLQQLIQQKNWLKSKNIDLKICGIANSKKFVVNSNEIDLKNWKNHLNLSNQPFNLTNLLYFTKKHYLTNPVIIDCTSDQNIANQYVSFINHGFHIVTPNKKANTSNWEYYQKIRSASIKSKKKFFYETNVGAGLPVIETLKNLLNTGDKLIHFRGILSGSLSFIFGKLEDNIPLSEATKQAQMLGFTEPNPKDDLSGIDVARKLLILAREIGYKLELKDIEIEPLLPKELCNISNINDFMIKLKELDKIFLKRVINAKKDNKNLRFIGIIDQKGNCRVKIDAISNTDPLYDIKNGENALAFYSKYYQPIPLVLRGYGAGNNVTASGVFSDVLRTLS